MAKKGEILGKMGDSTYYRTPDGKVVDDSGNEVKGPIAKTLAAEYEAKQQEKAKLQAEAKKAADEAKAAQAAQKAAETQVRQQRQAAERQAAAEMQRRSAAEQRTVSQAAKPQTPPAAAPKAPSAPLSSGEVKGAFKSAAMSVGQTAFAGAFPTLSGIINRHESPAPAPAAAGDTGGGGSRQSLNRIADEVNTTNMTLQTSIARQEMTNQILGLILKEVQQIKKPSIVGGMLDALGGALGLGAGAAAGAAAGAGKTGAKVVPKSGIMGKAAGGALRKAPLIGAVLGGGIDAYDEYQESGNATRAAATGVGSAAGGGLGAWGGAATGAAMGAVGGPVGIAIGGLLGALVGGVGGSWLGGKAGKGVYDAVASPSKGPTAAVAPEASADIRAAQAAKLSESPNDSTVTTKTLTFNADTLVFNIKNLQQAAQNAAAGATPMGGPAGATPIAAGPNGQSPAIMAALSTGTGAAPAGGRTGWGSDIQQAARQNAATTPFYAQPGSLPLPRVQPGQGAVGSAGGATGGVGGMSDASAVRLASTMVGKSRTDSLDYLKAGGYNNKGEAWCAEFVNSTLKQTGGTGSGAATANSFQKWGTQIDPTKVQAGDVVVQTRGKGPGEVGGHVGIATGVYQHGQIEMIAGNSGGAVKKYFVPVNGQLQVRRGSGGSGNNPKTPEATRDPSAGNAAGAARASNPSSTDATPSPGANSAASAGAGRGSVVEGLNDRANAQQEAGAGRGSVVEGLNDRANAQLGAGAGRGSVVEGLNDRSDAIKAAEPPAMVAAKLTPKESNVMEGFGGNAPPQLKRMMDGMLQGVLGRSRGSQLIQASMRDMLGDRSSRSGITVNQHTSATPKTDTTRGRHDSHHVGMVEPVDARARLRELFGIIS